MAFDQYFYIWSNGRDSGCGRWRRWCLTSILYLVKWARQGLRALAVTTTLRGVTPKAFLAALSTDQVPARPRRNGQVKWSNVMVE